MTSKLKATYHFPTEQYGYVEVEGEVESIEEAIDLYKLSRSPELPSGEGLDPQAWRDAYDGYMVSHTLTSEVYEKMNGFQQFAIQEEKKRYKRLKAKE